jgi:hypothetical protein
VILRSARWLGRLLLADEDLAVIEERILPSLEKVDLAPLEKSPSLRSKRHQSSVNAKFVSPSIVVPSLHSSTPPSTSPHSRQHTADGLTPPVCTCTFELHVPSKLVILFVELKSPCASTLPTATASASIDGNQDDMANMASRMARMVAVYQSLSPTVYIMTTSSMTARVPALLLPEVRARQKGQKGAVSLFASGRERHVTFVISLIQLKSRVQSYSDSSP